MAPAVARVCACVRAERAELLHESAASTQLPSLLLFWLLHALNQARAWVARSQHANDAGHIYISRH